MDYVADSISDEVLIDAFKNSDIFFDMQAVEPYRGSTININAQKIEPMIEMMFDEKTNVTELIEMTPPIYEEMGFDVTDCFVQELSVNGTKKYVLITKMDMGAGEFCMMQMLSVKNGYQSTLSIGALTQQECLDIANNIYFY